MQELFGKLPTGEEIYKFTLKSREASAAVTSWGARLMSFKPFGVEVNAGYDTLEEYLADGACSGGTVGRVANRIRGAAFTLDGVRYELTRNNGESCLHGGESNFAYKVWQVVSHTESSVKLAHVSPDGEAGFPGEVRVTAEYTLEGSALMIKYTVGTDKRTPIMMTNHAYFHLGGFDTPVTDYTLRVWAEEYCEVGEGRVATGRHLPLAGTPFDFTEGRRIGERIGESPIGYDHNFILSPTRFGEFSGERLGLAAEVRGDGLILRCYTNQPGVQLYVPANEMKRKLSGGHVRAAHGAFCLEAQIEPNCPNLGRGILDADEEYKWLTVYEVKKA